MRIVVVLLLLSSYVMAEEWFPTKLTLGTGYQSVRISHIKQPHQYQITLKKFKNEFYPLATYSQSRLLTLGVGSVTNFSTPDHHFNGVFTKAGVMAKAELTNSSIEIYPLRESLYGVIRFAEKAYLSYLSETLSSSNQLNTFSLGGRLRYPLIDPLFIVSAGWHWATHSDGIEGQGHYAEVTVPFSFSMINNETTIRQIKWGYSDAIEIENKLTYLTDFDEALSRRRFGDSDTTLFEHKLSYSKNNTSSYIKYQKLSEQEKWLLSLGVDVTLSRHAGVQFQIQKANGNDTIKLICKIHLLKVIPVEV